MIIKSTKMYYLVESDKTFEQASADLESAFSRFGFKIRFTHNLGERLRSKGRAYSEQCLIFEACNPELVPETVSSKVRQTLPIRIRITVFTEKGITKIVFNQKMQLPSALSQDAALTKAISEIEKKALQMVDEAR